MAINFASCGIVPGQDLQCAIAGQRARYVPPCTIHNRAQRSFRQAREMPSASWNGDPSFNFFDRTIGKSDLNHQAVQFAGIRRARKVKTGLTRKLRVTLGVLVMLKTSQISIQFSGRKIWATPLISRHADGCRLGRCAAAVQFSHASRRFDFRFRQASTDEKGQIVPGTFEEEFRRTMENLRRLLHAAGSDFDKVVQVRCMCAMPQTSNFITVIGKFLQPQPARTTLTNCLPEALHFEIECIAVAS